MLYNIWVILSVIFNAIVDFVSKIFSEIPSTAIPFLIAILFYAIITLFALWVDTEEEDSGDRTIAMIYYVFLIAFAAMFTMWRCGLVFMIEEKLTPTTLSEFVINMVLIVFAMGVVYSFYKNQTWLKKAIVILIWGCFLSLTFVICPYLFHESELSDNTLYQILAVAFVFGIPESIAFKRRRAKKDVLEKRGSKR